MGFTTEELASSLRNNNVSEHLHEGLVSWVRTGRPVGGFLTAVLENDLREAVFRADIDNLSNLRELCIWLHNYTPSPCHGSFETAAAWQKIGGLDGCGSRRKKR